MLSTTPIAYNWSGFYIGAHGGWGFGDGAFEDGFVVGGQLGVNWQFNSFVLGVEGDGSFVDWGETDAVGTVRLRGGFALDRFLPYGTGGARLRGLRRCRLGRRRRRGVRAHRQRFRRRRISPLRFRRATLADVIRGRINVTLQQPVRHVSRHDLPK